MNIIVLDDRLSIPSCPPRMNVGGSLLGMHPPVNEPRVPRMSGPLLQAPYELLPAPSSVERMDHPPLPPSPPGRPVMHMQSAGGFRREPSPPVYDLTVFVYKFSTLKI